MVFFSSLRRRWLRVKRNVKNSRLRVKRIMPSPWDGLSHHQAVMYNSSFVEDVLIRIASRWDICLEER